MSKDGTQRGGARVGAGRKPKAIHDKILEGNPGKRKLKILEIIPNNALKGEEMPKPRDYLKDKQYNTKDFLAIDIFEKTCEWLQQRNCLSLIQPQLLEGYAMTTARWIQCEQCISEYGLLAKHPTTGSAAPSPYVSMSQNYLKQVNNIWYQIYQVVRENCLKEYRGKPPHEDCMEKLLG